MKTLVEYINEKLIINKDFCSTNILLTPESTDEMDIKEVWDDIFDDIRVLTSGNIRLGKLRLKYNGNGKHKNFGLYDNNIFTLYPNYEGHIIIRSAQTLGSSVWIKGDSMEDVTEKLNKFLRKEGYIS